VEFVGREPTIMNDDCASNANGRTPKKKKKTKKKRSRERL
jgi:hypothetical protein